MSDRFEHEENKKARAEEEILSEEKPGTFDEGVSEGEASAADGRTFAGEDPSADGGTALGEHPPKEGMTSEREDGDTIEVEKISPGEVDERISSYVKEHIRNDGRKRRNSAFRILLFAVLITIVVFFFVDYVLMKRQLVSGWFAQKSATNEDGSESEASEDGKNGTDLADDSQTEPTPGVAGEDKTDSDESNQKSGDEDAQNGDGSTLASEIGDEDASGDNIGTVEGANEMDSSGEPETTEDPVRAVAQYLVYIEVTDTADGVLAQTGDIEDDASGQQSDRRTNQTAQTNQGSQTDDESEVTTEEESSEEHGQTHETTGIIVEIGQSAIRILTDYSSVEYAEIIEITFNGGETVQAQVETVGLNTGLALLVVSVAELSNETLKEIRTATWGDTAEITEGTELALVTVGGQSGPDEVQSASDEIRESSETESNPENTETKRTTESGENLETSGDGNLADIETDDSPGTEIDDLTDGDSPGTETDDLTDGDSPGTETDDLTDGDSPDTETEDLSGTETGDLTGLETEDSAETEASPGTNISLTEITILSVAEKKRPDAVFTTYSFAAGVDGCRILVDEDGDIVAIGTGTADSTGNTEMENDTAIAVAYRVDDLRLYIEKMVDGEAIPYVGITGVTVTDEIKESVSLDMPYGVYVWLADTGSPAYQAGILNGDIITAINGVEVTTVQEMRDAILGLEAGVEASFTLMRQGGSTYREYTIRVTPEAVETVINLELTN